MSLDSSLPPHFTTESRVRHRYFTFPRLAQMSLSELKEVFDNGETPDVNELQGWEFRGWNVGKITRLLGFQKFRKGFLPSDGGLHPRQCMGYNVIVEQNGLRDPHLALPDELNPKRHGYYLATPCEVYGQENLHPHALLLDYGRGEGDDPFYHPARLLRDYLVQVEAGNPDLYLGVAYLALGPTRVFSGYFVLERYNMIGL